MRADRGSKSPAPKFRNSGLRPRIGFAGIADFRSIIGQEYVAGIMKAARDYDVNLINFVSAIKYSVSNDIEFIKHYKKNFQFMNKKNIDGLIIWASSFIGYLPNEEIVRLGHDLAALPAVAIGVPLMNDLPRIAISNDYAIEAIIEHIVGHHGYQRVGIVSCAERPQYAERLTLFRRGLAGRGISLNEGLIHEVPNLDRRHVKSFVTDLFVKRGIRPGVDVQVLVTVTDIIALGLVEELAAIGIRVPEQLAVIGYNNQLQSIQSATPITTVDLEFFNQAYRAVELLLEEIDHREAGLPSVGHRILNPRLIVRQSCGCFEDLIAEVRSPLQATDPTNRQQRIIEKIADLLSIILNDGAKDFAEHFLAAADREIHDGAAGATLQLIRELHTTMHDQGYSDGLTWQQLISDLRSASLPYLFRDTETLLKAETIFHQARIIGTVLQSYETNLKASNMYQFNVLARIAMDFASSLSRQELVDKLALNLDELAMPEIWLVLYDELRLDLAEGNLILVHESAGVERPDEIERRIPADRLVPDRFLPKNRRYDLILEILYFGDRFMGYALIEVGSQNISLYDTVRSLLSHSMYVTYLRDAKPQADHQLQLLLRTPTVRGILDDHPEVIGDSANLGVRKIVEYLIANLAKPTDLEVIATDLGLSKSHLIRKTKQLTGYTVQKLHETLKIERAKMILDHRVLSIAEVAERIGYQNQFYFSKVFKKIAGLSPRQWMSRNQQPAGRS